MALMISSCGSTKDAYLDNPIMLDTLEIATTVYKPVYHPSEKRIHDLIHTILDIRFDWEKEEVIGKAELTLEPYFYPAQFLSLDAKGFEIQRIAMKRGASKKSLDYTYDDKIIKIDLEREFLRGERYEIYIEYIARPNSLLEKKIIKDPNNQGLFFRNADKSNPAKMRQIFTQGETEQSSCWFPTIDSPNERTSQEVFITIEDDLVSLSNGKLVRRIDNGDGTHTDHWSQAQHHAPYLFAMAIGEFSVVKDEIWNGKIIDYYVAPEYKDYAKDIFKNTREILTFYSNIFGVEYPWDKYSQVIADDFVTGAMENTSAVIFFEGLHMTDRELLDSNYEPIIAHEAAHHWFGDYVTCESWANIALNESFATYAEIIWERHKYGNDAGHYMVMDYLESYMADADDNPKKIIRYSYEHPDDLFDSHSYEKGGHVLYMLHNYLGDDAFYEAVTLYLKRHAYRTVEIHDLRMAFEEVCGEDLNWYFDQWFFKAGYPELDVTYDINELQTTVNITQSQENGVTYRLPLALDIYTSSGVERQKIVIDEKKNSFTYKTDGPAMLVNIDADNILLGTINEERNTASYVYEYQNAPHFQDRFTSLKALLDKESTLDLDQSERVSILKESLRDKFWAIRELAIESIDLEDEYAKENYEAVLKEIAVNDDKTSVSASAIGILGTLEVEDFTEELITLSSSLSFSVAASALMALAKVDSETALRIASAEEKEKNRTMKRSVLDVYAYHGSSDKDSYFKTAILEAETYTRYPALYYYSYFLVRQSQLSLIKDGVNFISQEVKNKENPIWLRRITTTILSDMLPVVQQRRDRERDEMKPEELQDVKDHIEKTVTMLKEEYPELKLVQQIKP